MDAMVIRGPQVIGAPKVSPAWTGPYDWFPDWHGQTAVIIGSGPSAKTVDLSIARDRAKIIAVNTSYQLCPWADVLYACDFSWWSNHKGAPEFHGLKVSICQKSVRAFKTIRLVRRKFGDKGDELEFADRGLIGWGRNGGFQALNLAIQFGSHKIILVGFDMRIDRGLHWHGKHPKHNPHDAQVQRWRKVLDDAAPSLKANGVRVINSSLVSALRSYPKMTLAGALAA